MWMFRKKKYIKRASTHAEFYAFADSVEEKVFNINILNILQFTRIVSVINQKL